VRRLRRTVFVSLCFTQTARRNLRRIRETDSQTDRLTRKTAGNDSEKNAQKIKKCDMILSVYFAQESGLRMEKQGSKLAVSKAEKMIKKQ
jgi:hypothetical protein